MPNPVPTIVLLHALGGSGRSFVQLYTAFAYEGPGLLRRIKRELLDAMDAEGFRTVAEAVGTAR